MSLSARIIRKEIALKELEWHIPDCECYIRIALRLSQSEALIKNKGRGNRQCRNCIKLGSPFPPDEVYRLPLGPIGTQIILRSGHSQNGAAIVLKTSLGIALGTHADADSVTRPRCAFQILTVGELRLLRVRGVVHWLTSSVRNLQWGCFGAVYACS